MQRRAQRAQALALLFSGLVAGCDNDLSSTRATEASVSQIQATASEQIVNSFIDIVELQGADLQKVGAVEFTIEPKSGSVSKPVHVQYSMGALERRGYVDFASNSDGKQVKVPVFGLYAGYENNVSLQLHFQDGSVATLPVVIETAPYTDPNGIYDHPDILTKRAAGTTLGFDFFVLKSAYGSPVIVDTDGEIRWLVAREGNSVSSTIQGDTFIIGDSGSPDIFQLRLDGTLSQYSLGSPVYTNFHHNIDPGKSGLFAEVNATDAANPSITDVESIAIEISSSGSLFHQWDLGAILSAYMSAHGDDPSAFVRLGVDWFHMNATTYDPSDDSIIVSSRENFLIKLDYNTGGIRWILGDPTKYWYTFASLRAKALTLQAGGLYPIGQHAVSITSDGLVMVFNDGLGSVGQPPGAPAGESRTYSAVSAYSIDATTASAQEVWRFDYNQSIFSSICSSAYEASGNSLLVDYATADSDTHARLVGLDSGHNVVFEFEYPTTGCNTAWNAIPISLDNLSII